VRLELSFDGRPPAHRGGRGRGEGEGDEGGSGDGAGHGVEGHPQSAGSQQEDDVRDLNPSQVTVPLREPRAEAVAEQDQSDDEGGRSRDKMRVERPGVASPEIILPAEKEVGVEVGGNVAVVDQDDADSDLEYEQAGQPFDDREGCD